MDRMCHECRWWKDNGSALDNSGDCRRFPPTITGTHPRGGIVATFPKTTSRDWCGEYAPKDRTDDLPY